MIAVICVASVALLGLVVWSGTAMLRNAEGGASVGNAFGSGLGEIFDPGQARSQRDLHEQLEKTEVAPTPTGDGPVRVDLTSGVIHLRR